MVTSKLSVERKGKKAWLSRMVLLKDTTRKESDLCQLSPSEVVAGRIEELLSGGRGVGET